MEDLVISKENKEEIISIIQSFKEIDRKIFIRRYFIQEDIIEIARSLGIDRTVVDNRLSRGRKVLKEKLTFLRKGGCMNE